MNIMQNLFLKINASEIKSTVKKAALRFPWTVFVTAALSVFLILMIEQVKSINLMFKNPELFAVCLALTLSLSIGLKLFKESLALTFKAPIDLDVGFLSVLNILGLYYYLLDQSEMIISFKVVILAFIYHLFVSLAPFLTEKENDNNRFWNYNYNILFRFSDSIRYATIIFLGFSVFIGLVSFLFGYFDIKSFGYLLVFCFVIFQTIYFMADIPVSTNQYKQPVSLDNLFRLTKFVLIPFSALYILLLYIYLFKILLFPTKEYISIGWLVSLISIVGIITLLLIYPFKESNKNVWIKYFWKGFFISIIPLLGMLFFDIIPNVISYGFTENRYIILLSGFVLFVFCIHFLFAKKENLKWIPLGLLLASLVTLIGPLSAFNVSVISQLRRAEKILKVNSVSTEENLKSLSFNDALQLQAVISFLEFRYPENLNNFLVKNFKDIITENKSTLDPSSGFLKTSVLNLLAVPIGKEQIYLANLNGSGVKYFKLRSNLESDFIKLNGSFKIIGLTLNNYMTQNLMLSDKENLTVSMIDGVDLKFYHDKADQYHIVDFNNLKMTMANASASDLKNGTYILQLPEKEKVISFSFNNVTYQFVIGHIDFRFEPSLGAEGKYFIQQIHGLLYEPISSKN